MYVVLNVMVLGYFVRVNERRGERLKLKTRRDRYARRVATSINFSIPLICDSRYSTGLSSLKRQAWIKRMFDVARGTASP